MDQQLVGLIEIAMRAGVQRPVVSTWRTRHADFPRPLTELAIGPIFWWPDIERWLTATGRKADATLSREDIRPSADERQTEFPSRRKGSNQ